MKKIWNSWLQEAVFIYCFIYTAVTIVNSIAYLMQGIREDPSGNWHELTRAMITFIGVFAYILAKKLPVKNVFLRSGIVYAITLPFVFCMVWMWQFIEPLAESAYRDIFFNYTGLFLIVSSIAMFGQKVRGKGQV